MEYDLLVIGAGPAGYVAAIRAAQLGMKTAVVERSEIGGTCLNVGCIPTKQFFASAAVAKHCREAEKFGLRISGLSVDADLLQKNKKKVVRALTGGVALLLKANGVAVENGTAALAGGGRLAVMKTDGNVRNLLARHILIATGSVASALSIEGGDSVAVIDNVGALNLEVIPERLVIIGAGVIGVEFAGIYSAFGSNVTLIELEPNLLPTMDKEAGAAMKKELEKQGVRIFLNTRVHKLETTQNSVVVSVGAETVQCDLVLNATGRKPLTEGLNLAGAGVGTDRRGFIVVDENYETSATGIYAVGDVIAGPMLAHVASAEAVTAVERMAGRDSAVDYELVTQSVFSFPEYSMIGLTEEAARKQYGDVRVSRFFFRGNGKALTMNDGEGFVKIIAAPGDDSILGVHILGPHASDLIAEAAVAMNAMLTVTEYARIMRGHPTLSEALHEAASDLMDSAIHVLPSVGKKEAL